MRLTSHWRLLNINTQPHATRTELTTAVSSRVPIQAMPGHLVRRAARRRRRRLVRANHDAFIALDIKAAILDNAADNVSLNNVVEVRSPDGHGPHARHRGRGWAMTVFRFVATAISGAASLLLGFACETRTNESTEEELSGWCLCRADCAELPTDTTLEEVVENGAMCGSPDCPSNHHCVVTAWSEQETTYYGKCYLACEEACGVGTEFCATRVARAVHEDGFCEPSISSDCVMSNTVYDCRSQTLSYTASCIDSSVTDIVRPLSGPCCVSENP